MCCSLLPSVMSNSCTPWIVAHQASLSMGFSSQEYWSGLPFPSPNQYITFKLETGAYQAPPSTGFSSQEYWSGLPFPSPGDLPDSGIEPISPVLAGRFFTAEPLGKPLETVLEHKGV